MHSNEEHRDDEPFSLPEPAEVMEEELEAFTQRSNEEPRDWHRHLISWAMRNELREYSIRG